MGDKLKTLIRYMVYSLNGDPLDASLFADEQDAIERAKHFQEAIVYAVSVRPYITVWRPVDTKKDPNLFP